MITEKMTTLMRTLALSLCMLLGLPAYAETLPNFLIMMADDLGSADLGCFGSKTIKTPYLDKMAGEGVRCTQFYVPAPSCSPSRGGMMTGRSPHRLGIYTYIHKDTVAHLQSDEITFGKLLKQKGYDTCFVGKWGLNAHNDFKNEPTPSDHGFDHWLATQNNSIPDHKDPETFVRNGEVLGKVEGYACQIVVDEAIKWMGNRKDKSKPFCLVVWTHEPHLALAHPEQFSKMYQGQGLTEQKQEYNANVSHLDYQLGRLLAEVERLKYQENTFTFFASDNGAKYGDKNLAGDSGIYRSGKGMVYEGGIRMPTIIRWPTVVKPGTSDNTALSTLDLLPTICSITGLPVPADRAIDGSSFYDHLKGEEFERKTPLFFMNPITAALRRGEWKLVVNYETTAGHDGMLGYFRNRELLGFETKGVKAPQLYNLNEDVSEKKNVISRHPEIAASMLQKISNISRNVQKDMPDQPGPNFLPPKLYLQLTEANPNMPIPQQYRRRGGSKK